MMDREIVPSEGPGEHNTSWRPWLALLPSAVVWLVLILATGSTTLAPHGLFSRPWEFFGWLLLAALAAVHRPLGEDALGGASLGLGALVLPLALFRLGTVPTVALAGLAFLLIEIGRLLARRRSAAEMRDGGWLGETLERTSLLMGAVLVSGVVSAIWLVTEGPGGTTVSLPSVPELGWWSVAPPLAYLFGFIVLAVSPVLLRQEPNQPLGLHGAELNPFSVDAIGWILGTVLASFSTDLGWARTALLATILALFAAEAARQAWSRESSEQRTADLERLQHAHQRILREIAGIGGIAQQILVECRNILPVRWFHFELPEPKGVVRHWSAGPDGVLHDGKPRPEARPPALPGVHRRVSWRILEKRLRLEDEELARFRLWCDPRRIEGGAEELLATLVPQMASSLYRAQLDREARLDPLTNVPVRRLLESRLQKVYAESCEEGKPFSVIMCDIDHFKGVNDTYGHAAGDAALILFAQTLDQHRRDDDLCARYGGEEFTVLLENTSGDEALGLAERLRQAVEALEFEYEGQPIPLTFSSGVASFPELLVKTASELLLLADEALYAAKEQGRNRALLNLGRGAFRGPTGPTIRTADALSSASIPRPRILG